MRRTVRKTAPVMIGICALSMGLSACTASRYQISDALQRFGMSNSQASCASEFLRGKLSVPQVNRLSDAARDYRSSNDRLTFGDLVRVAATVGDPQVILQVGASAAACGLVADRVIPGF